MRDARQRFGSLPDLDQHSDERDRPEGHTYSYEIVAENVSGFSTAASKRATASKTATRSPA